MNPPNTNDTLKRLLDPQARALATPRLSAL